MKILPSWLRDFVDFKIDLRTLADELTMAGIAVESISGEGDDTVFEMEITTNRVDAMNHYGVAREVSALYDLELKPIEPKLPAHKGEPGFSIEIEEPALCPRFSARAIRNVKIGPSPEKVAKRLLAMGSRGINNVADATNYNLFESGKPTHAFDMDLLEGGKLVVRKARAGEKLKTLDGVERTLTPEDLVVADGVKAVGLAGTMGGWDTMITEKTKNVLIESAWWDPLTVRRMSRRHGLHTDASHRFERGADFESTVLSTNRVAELVLASAGGELQGELVDVVVGKVGHAPVQLRHSEVLRHLGKNIPVDEITRILRRLGFKLTAGRRTTVSVPQSATTTGSGGSGAAIAEQPTDFEVAIPSWRLDVEREIDVIEEIARVHGYNKFPNTLPAFSGAVIELPHARHLERLRSRLLALGYNEALSPTFIGMAEAQKFARTPIVELENPLSEEASVMRSSLVPGMLAMMAWNLNRGNSDVRLFEMGNVFCLSGERTEESRVLSIGATGSAEAGSVHGKARAYSFYDLKGDIEALLQGFGQTAPRFEAGAADYYHPARAATATIDGEAIARFGQVHPEHVSWKNKQDVYLAEVDLEKLYSLPLRQARYTPLSKFPAIERDFSMLFDQGTRFEQIEQAVAALKIAEMRSFVPVETFSGGNVPAGKYSLLLRATFQSSECTLRDDEVAGWAQQIVQALGKLGGTLRG